MSSQKTLKERKEELVAMWEECFERKVTDALSKEGLAVFWSNNTSYQDAGGILDIAAVLVSIGACDDDEEIHIEEAEDDVETVQAIEGKFFVYDKAKNQLVSSPFPTRELAFEGCKNYCLEHGYKLSTVKVCQVYE